MKKTAFSWFFDFLKKHTGKMLIGLVIITIVSATAVVNPYISGLLIDKVLIGQKYNLLGKYIFLLVSTKIIRDILHYLARMLFEYSSQGVLYDMRKEVFHKFLKEDFSFYNTNRTGDLMSRQIGDMQAIRHFVAFVIFTVYQNILWFIFALVMIFTVNTKLALMFLIVLPLSALTSFWQMKSVKPAFYNIRKKFSSLNAYVQENIAANRVVRAFAKEQYEINRFEKENQGFRQAELDASKVWQRFVPIFEFLATVINVILMIYGGYLVIKGEMTLGNFVTVNGYLWMLTLPLRQMGWLINDSERFGASLKRIYETYQIEPQIKLKEEQECKHKLNGKVEFKNVSYRVNDTDILSHISFKVEKGKSIGIIGRTGSGKTTIMNLLCRFYDVSAGEILVDDKDVRCHDLYNLRYNIGMAMQDVFLFSDTIEGNIAYGRPDCSFEKVEKASKMADAHAFISSLPEGYDTIVGERGVGLSGGQKQRISLARALVTDPSIIILDDTTSAVDMETESLIQKELASISNERTVFIIAYRISSVKDCDTILVLDKGKIIESGTHQELLEQKGYYESVYRHQYGEFNNNGTK